MKIDKQLVLAWKPTIDISVNLAVERLGNINHLWNKSPSNSWLRFDACFQTPDCGKKALLDIFVLTTKWNCPRWGLNSQPPHLSSTYTAYKYSALTDCATGAIMPTHRTVLTIHNNKNHACFMEQDNTEINNTQTVLEKQIIPGGIRTHGLWIRSPTRYPLRYRDTKVNIIHGN